jgi:hypothetical protein
MRMTVVDVVWPDEACGYHGTTMSGQDKYRSFLELQAASQ